MDIIKTIRAEVERRIKKEELYLTADNANNKERGVWIERDKELLSFLDTLQEPENPIYELNQYLINWVRDGQTDAEKDARWEAYRRFFELHDEAMMQEPDGLHFLPMVRLVEMIRTDEWNDRGKRYAEKLVSALENEGYPTDARLVRNHIKYMDGEDVPMATMDNQEPEIDFEQELYNRFGMVKDFTLGMRIAQCFYNLGLKNAK